MEEKAFERTLAVLGVIALCVLLYLGFSAGNASAATVCQIGNGCTGTSTSPAYGKVLVGGSNGEYEFAATSSFGSAGAGTVTSVGASSPGSTITIGGTNPITGSGSITYDVNLGSSNQYTASTTFTKVVNLANASSSLNTFGTVWIPSITSALHLADSSGKITAYTGTSCTNQFVRSLNGAGVATCNTVSLTSDVTGTLPLANGGTNASLSGASGIAAMNSGNSALSIPSTSYTLSSLLLTAPNASTTNLTAGSFFDAPNSGTVPASLVAGAVYVNTNSVASSSVAFGASSQNNNLFAVHSMSMVLASSTLAYDGAYGSSGTTTIVIANPLHKSTVVSYYCITDTGTVYVGLGTGSATTTETQCTSSGTQVSLSTSNTFNGRQKVYLEVGHEASTPNQITITADVDDSN